MLLLVFLGSVKLRFVLRLGGGYFNLRNSDADRGSDFVGWVACVRDGFEAFELGVVRGSDDRAISLERQARQGNMIYLFK